MTTLIWPNTPLTTFLKNLYPDCKIISTAEDWKKQDYTSANRIFLLAEFFGQEQQPAEFWGFRILRYLRVERKVTVPIIICSFFPLPWFQQDESQPAYKIFKTPGHYFFQLPLDWDDLFNQDFEEIDKNTLDDINNHFFDLEGVIDQVVHDFMNQIIQDQEEFESVTQLELEIKKHLDNSFLSIKNILSLTDNKPLEQIHKDLWQVLKRSLDKDGKVIGGLTTVDHFIGQVKRLLPPRPKEKKDEAIETNIRLKKIPWKVLFVDDDIGTAKRVQKMFKDKGITCKTAQNATDTYKILKNDQVENLITVLICDYRLQTPDKVWQKIQGYNILREVFLNFPNQLALFSLTSFNKRALLRIQHFQEMQVWSYAKQDVIDVIDHRGFNVFVEKVIEEGNRVFDWKRSQPTASSWTKGYAKKFDRPLQDYYRLHRMEKDFVAANGFIEKSATEIYKSIKKAKHGNGVAELLEIPNLQESIGKDKSTAQSDETKMERFREILLGRRIAIALLHYLKMDKWQIFNTMKRKRFTPKPPIENDNTVNQYFSTYMALKLDKDIPKNLLPEEWEWLKNLEKDIL